MAVQLLEHQRAGIKAAVPVLKKTGGFYLNHDPGMGKSLSAIAIARLLGCKRILVLGPVVSLGVWADPERGEIKRWWPDARTTIVRDEKWSCLNSCLSDGTQSLATVVVTNYDQTIARMTHREKEQILEDALTACKGDEKKARRRAAEKVRKILRERLDAKLQPLIDWGIDILICDEAQYLKNPTSLRYKSAEILASQSKYTLEASGTPAHDPLDWWAQWHLIAPHEPMWSQPFSAYKRWIAVFGGPTNLWVTGFRPDAKNAALRALAPYTHVAKASELNLPEPLYTVVPVELSKEERRAYLQMEKQLVVELEGEEVLRASIVLTKMLRLQQIAAGHLQEKGIHSSKLDACLELLNLRQHQKVIVACRFKWELSAIRKALGTSRVVHWYIDGSVPAERRKEIEESFQSHSEGCVLLTQFRAGGMSLTFTRADALIFYSLEHSYIAYQQMFGRFFRIGLDHVTQVLVLTCNGTVDEPLWIGLQNKADDDDMARLLRESLKER